MHTHLVIVIDGVDYEVSERTLTGAQIKALAHIPPANLLYRIENGKRELIADTESVHLHDHEKFVSAPPVGGAS